MVNYLSKFLPHLAEETHSLRNLLKDKAECVWDSNTKNVFQRVKALITVVEMLAYYDVKKDAGSRCVTIYTENSNSNWTFIALNLPNRKGTLGRNKTKTVNQFQCPGTEKSSAPWRTPG